MHWKALLWVHFLREFFILTFFLFFHINKCLLGNSPAVNIVICLYLFAIYAVCIDCLICLISVYSEFWATKSIYSFSFNSFWRFFFSILYERKKKMVLVFESWKHERRILVVGVFWRTSLQRLVLDHFTFIQYLEEAEVFKITYHLKESLPR